ncbi:hypothetical protein Syun_023061 [Stephania yunnanensis]|uniref:Uncharacterized protein n=1 Tax=Stephania yunnanensis TaxID=152371 RepID=A0AAP0F871_9MAGN
MTETGATRRRDRETARPRQRERPDLGFGLGGLEELHSSSSEVGDARGVVFPCQMWLKVHVQMAGSGKSSGLREEKGNRNYNTEDEEEREEVEELEEEIPMGERNYVIEKENFFNENAYEKFRNDLVNDRKLISVMGFNVKNELTYRPRILDIIEASLQYYEIVNYKVALFYYIVMRLGYLDVEKIIYESIRSSITTKKNDGLPFPLMILTSCKADLVNMAELDIDILLEKEIMDEVIKRYGRVNGYEDT